MIGSMTDPADPFTRAEASAVTLGKLAGTPSFDVAVVLGSGWIAAADAIGKPAQEITLSDIPGFPVPTVTGHAGAVRYVVKDGLRVLVFLGRVHLYEGHNPNTVVHAVRTSIAAGCRAVILTNAAGGIRAEYQVGQPVLINDHINLTGRSPLTGPPPPDGYPGRFTDLTDLYSQRLRALARDTDPSLAEGVYAALPGPHYETPAEIRMLRTAGADLVGMSTALEAIAARHLGAEVLAISLVTNPAAGLSAQPLDHREVVSAAATSAARIGDLLSSLLLRL
jgi:purine-nucleoside phosphorylase